MSVPLHTGILLMINRLALGAVLFTFSCGAFSYDTETHALITQFAWERSVLSDKSPGSVLDVLGLLRLMNGQKDFEPFGPYWEQSSAAFPAYYTDGVGGFVDQDAYDAQVVIAPESFERCQMQEFVPGSTILTNNPKPAVQQFSNPIYGDSVTRVVGDSTSVECRAGLSHLAEQFSFCAEP
jgi:hypothetical protein